MKNSFSRGILEAFRPAAEGASFLYTVAESTCV